jgi:N-acetyl-anhydromuramyl-L-alanine amidase AmpD
MVQAFPEGGYGWHLGKNGSQHMHTHSVGIEVCNFGYVVNGKTYAGTRVDDSQIVTLDKPFRGHKTWHRYSDAQIEELRKWILWIGERDSIDVREGLPTWIKQKGTDAFEWNEDAYYGKVKGLLTHTNTRRDKTDMFPQPELIDMLLSL